jgi:hypothetical protein
MRIGIRGGGLNNKQAVIRGCTIKLKSTLIIVSAGNGPGRFVAAFSRDFRPVSPRRGILRTASSCS